MTEIITVTPADLRALISEAVKEAMEDRPTERAHQPEIVDTEFLISKLGVTRQTLSNWRTKNKIPFIKQGKVIRYDYIKVIEALENKKGGAGAKK